MGPELEQISARVRRLCIEEGLTLHDPGTGAGLENALSYDGELVILVEQGTLEVDVAGQRFDLCAGDTLHFETSHPHCWRNAGDAPMSALFFGTSAGGFGERGDG